MSCTVRILSLDGGGQRGYLSTVWLKLFIQQWGIEPTDLWKYFDVISGSSIGGVAALAYALGLNPDVIENFFVERGPYVFTIRNNPLTCSFGGISGNSPSNTPNNAQKLALILANSPFYSTSGDCTTYGSTFFYQTLVDTFGTNTLQDLKTNTLITTYNQIDNNSGKFILYSNVEGSNYFGQNETLVNVAKSTSAAPVYLPSVTLNEKVYIDGGVYNNNPSALALSLGKSLKPTANRFCVLSIGTGIGEMEFYESPTDHSLSPSQVGPFDTIQQIFGLFNIASTGGQESTAKAIEIESENALTNLYEYRFQVNLDPLRDTNLDNTSPEIMEYYRTVATEAFNNDLPAIINFIGHLTA